MGKNTKQLLRARRKKRVRKKIFGTPERPRLSVFKSLKHIYVQAIDDVNQKTIVSASTLEKEVKTQIKYGGNIAAARIVGNRIAEKLLKLGIKKAVFDRAGYKYHGRVKALAEGAREKGLQF